MKLEPIRNTKLIKITFTSDDPNEAAKVANAIAAAYQNYRLERLHQQTVGGIKVLTEQFRKGEQEIKSQRDKIDGLKKKITEPVPELTSPTINHSPLTNRPNQELPGTNVLIYFTAVRQLAAMEDLQALLAAKIEQEKFYLQIPKTTLVQIVDLAEPSQFPIGPNRWLGAASLLIGLALVGGGFILHKFVGPSDRPTS
jgi:uncharacterized protein involved in exopolysaccharide biosynthesis